MKRFREHALTTQQKQRYNDFKQTIKDRYDYISIVDIARINKDFGYPVTLEQCKRIYYEFLGGDSE